MRVRVANPFDEAHGKNLRCYDFVADGTKNPSEILAATETATGLKLQGDPAGQDGFINTSLRPDGSRLVSIVLYEACSDASHRHPPHRKAPDLDMVKQTAVKAAVGEHPQHRLTGQAQADAAKLRALGFRDIDPPLRS